MGTEENENGAEGPGAGPASVSRKEPDPSAGRLMPSIEAKADVPESLPKIPPAPTLLEPETKTSPPGALLMGSLGTFENDCFFFPMTPNPPPLPPPNVFPELRPGTPAPHRPLASRPPIPMSEGSWVSPLFQCKSEVPLKKFEPCALVPTLFIPIAPIEDAPKASCEDEDPMAPKERFGTDSV